MNKNNLPTTIPVFPLSNFIIFPKTTVPLNIFEPRYIDMINDSMKLNKLIGMIQPIKDNSAGSEENFGVVVSGHDSAIATAQQLAKTESYRDTASFADIVRGMQLYGRKILRPEAIMTANYNLA